MNELIPFIDAPHHLWDFDRFVPSWLAPGESPTTTPASRPSSATLSSWRPTSSTPAPSEIVDTGRGESVEGVVATVDRLLGTGRASTDSEAVIEAARTGRVASMIPVSGGHRWGRRDADDGKARFHHERQPGDHDLLDEAAVRAWMSGAAVFVVPQDRLNVGAEVAAIFRY